MRVAQGEASFCPLPEALTGCILAYTPVVGFPDSQGKKFVGPTVLLLRTKHDYSKLSRIVLSWPPIFICNLTFDKKKKELEQNCNKNQSAAPK